MNMKEDVDAEIVINTCKVERGIKLIMFGVVNG